METDYPSVRRVLGDRHRRLDDLEVEDLLEQVFPDRSPGEVEDFMGTLQSFAKQAAPLAQQALPGAIQGAQQGAMVGGPWGAVIGALGGGAASLLSKQGGAPSPAPSPAQPTAPAQPVATPATTGQQATADLLGLLSRPETMQALLSLLMAQAGRSNVTVGQNLVPAQAFANAISETAARIGESAAPSEDDKALAYLRDSAGEARCDIANPADRARLLLGDLAEQARREAADQEALEEEVRRRRAMPPDSPDPLQAYLDVVEGRNYSYAH
jgi:hypothetical protein